MSDVLSVANLGWYALKVRPQNERSISRLIQETFGVKTSVPLQNVQRRIGGRKVLIKKPFFSNYVFLFANLKELSMRHLHSFGGVYGVIREGGVPAQIPEEQIKSIELLAESDSPFEYATFTNYKPRDKVVVVEGPLEGAVGSFVKTGDEKGKLILSLHLFKRTMVVELDAGNIEPF